MKGNFSYFRDKRFRNSIIAVFCGFSLLWSTAAFGYSSLLISVMKNEQLQKNELICASISHRLDNIARTVANLQKSTLETTWVQKLISGSFKEEFTAYHKLQYCLGLQRSISGIPAISRMTLLFPEINTAVTDVTWTDIADCSNYFWEKYSLDITPIVKDVSAPVPYIGDGYTNQYYFIGEYMLLLQKLEIGTKPRVYALYTIPIGQLLTSGNSLIKEDERDCLIQFKIETYSDGKAVSSYVHSDASYAKKSSKLYNITKEGMFPGCNYIFSVDAGLSSADATKSILIYVIAAVSLLIGLILIWKFAILLHRPENSLKTLSHEENALGVLFKQDILNETACRIPEHSFDENDEIDKIGNADNSDMVCNESPLLNQSIVDYVNENYCDCNISLKGLSEDFNTSISTVSRSFKRATGVNFSEYLTALRMKRAKELLDTEDCAVHTVAVTVGYENDYSFRRAFERSEGMRLQEYRSGSSSK